ALIAASQAKSLPAKARSLADVRAADIAPVAPGIRETSTGLTMGESAERMAAINRISRESQDAWALRSHERAAAAWDDGRLAQEVAPVYLDGHAVTADNHIRRDSSLEKLAALRPVFDREHGTITAGNASPLTDGAGPRDARRARAQRGRPHPRREAQRDGRLDRARASVRRDRRSRRLEPRERDAAPQRALRIGECVRGRRQRRGHRPGAGGMIVS